MSDIAAPGSYGVPNIGDTVVACVNASTLLSDDEIAKCAAALQVQVRRDFAPLWNLDCDVVAVPRTGTPPAGAWWLVFSDDSDQAGALGYHDMTSGPDPKPLGKVFAKTDLMNNAKWTTTASHEILEMLADPRCRISAGPFNNSIFYAYEVCDAVEAYEYAIDGVTVSDFVTPAWFDDGPGTKYSFMDNVSKSLQLARGGYISIWTPSVGWSEITADKSPRTLLRSRGRRGSRRERRRVGHDRWVVSSVKF